MGIFLLAHHTADFQLLMSLYCFRCSVTGFRCDPFSDPVIRSAGPLIIRPRSKSVEGKEGHLDPLFLPRIRKESETAHTIIDCIIL